MTTTAPSPAAGATRKRERLARLCDGAVVRPVLRLLFRRPGIVCITHHRIADAVQHDSDVISATPAQLRAQAAWVRNTFRVVSGQEVVDVAARGRPLREPALAFTFDDAYADNYEAGRMLMDEFGIAATFFVPTGFIETGLVPAWDRLGYAVRATRAAALEIPRLDGHGPWVQDVRDYGVAMTSLMGVYGTLPAVLQEPFVSACEGAAGASAAGDGAPSPFMTWAQVRALRDMGHTIGAHTHTHPVLAALGREQQRDEIERSKRILEERLQEQVAIFAYPYGKPGRSFTDATKALVADCGFEAACSFYGGWNRPGRIDRFDVRRMKVDPATSPAMFRTRVISRGAIPV